MEGPDAGAAAGPGPPGARARVGGAEGRGAGGAGAALAAALAARQRGPLERELRARARARVAEARRERVRLEGLLGAAEARREGLKWRCEAKRREVAAGQRRLAEVRSRELDPAAHAHQAMRAQKELWQGLQVQLWRAQADLVGSLSAAFPAQATSEGGADEGAVWGQLLLVGSVLAKVLGSPALHEAALAAGTQIPGFGGSRSRVWKLRSNWVASSHLPAAPPRAAGEPPDPHELPLYPACATDAEGDLKASTNHAMGFREARRLIARSIAASAAALQQHQGAERNRCLHALSMASTELLELCNDLIAAGQGAGAAEDDAGDWEFVDAYVPDPRAEGGGAPEAARPPPHPG